jgi:hypothetical protein
LPKKQNPEGTSPAVGRGLFRRTVAVRLIKKKGADEYGMLDFRNSPWFIAGRHECESKKNLIASFEENIIRPAEAKVKELRPSN